MTYSEKKAAREIRRLADGTNGVGHTDLLKVLKSLTPDDIRFFLNAINEGNSLQTTQLKEIESTKKLFASYCSTLDIFNDFFSSDDVTIADCVDSIPFTKECEMYAMTIGDLKKYYNSIVKYISEKTNKSKKDIDEWFKLQFPAFMSIVDPTFLGCGCCVLGDVIEYEPSSAMKKYTFDSSSFDIMEPILKFSLESAIAIPVISKTSEKKDISDLFSQLFLSFGLTGSENEGSRRRIVEAVYDTIFEVLANLTNMDNKDIETTGKKDGKRLVLKP